MKEVFHCGTCGLFNPDTEQCMINIPLYDLEDPRDGYCHNHTFRPKKCDCCGNKVVPWAKMIYMGNDVMICPDCNQKFGLCETCRQTRQDCNFMIMSQTSGIPPVVQKIAQQGGMQMITQVKNPQLIERACKDCPCYVAGECGQDTGSGCNNYRLHSIRE